jgi:glutamate N-acetyltransferase/amino-acid N-acetyltransferase
MCKLVESETGAPANEVIVASTGVIGEPLNIEPIRSGMGALVAGLSRDGQGAAEAIMTTDTAVKQIAVEFLLGDKTCRIGAMAKGSGMIMPNMATLLGVITTDAAIEPDALNVLLHEAVEDSFNMVSIDGDTSTNDMVSIMASGLIGNKPVAMTGSEERGIFLAALKHVCAALARMIAKDGEGATKLITCHAANAPDKYTARVVAKSVINSSLMKAAMFAADANWGRILCAIGYAPAEFDIDMISVSLSSNAGAVKVCEHGSGIGFDEVFAKRILLEDEIIIEIDMAQGNGEAAAWGCDLTYDYVKINGSYRT